MKMQTLVMVVAACLVAEQAHARFVSVDPMPPDPNTGENFNRYYYANNNPYKNVDPDGRRSLVTDSHIFIQPEDKTVPAVSVPIGDTGAKGVSPSDLSFHTYNVDTPSLLSPSQAGEGLKNSPTPGSDNSPASPGGTKNNAGAIPTLGDTNMVRSYSIASPDPSKYTDITVNYTINGAHGLTEGFVERYGSINADGTVHLRSYGEGNNWHQAPVLKPLWGPKVESTWQQNQQDIINAYR